MLSLSRAPGTRSVSSHGRAPLAAVRFVVGLSLATSACGKPLSKAECNGLLDRYVEKLVGADRPEAPPGEVFRLKSEARTRAAKDPAFGECSEQVSRRAFDCAMGAISADEMEQCLL
jgi:hypothetical protein